MARWISQNRAITRHPLIRESARQAGAKLVAGKLAPESDADRFIGWGYKSSGLWAREQARKHSIAFRLFEDGFVRSLEPGYGHGAIYSLVEDGSGIYYDGTGASDLVTRLNRDFPDEDGWENDALAELARYREVGASKYNCFEDQFDTDQLEREMPEPGVLIVDQTAGDASIRYGGLEESDFEKLLDSALDENPGKPVYLRGHPDELFRAKRSSFPKLVGDDRVRHISPLLAPWQILARCERVYVGTSLLGFEALLHETPVVTFGCPFYAGWGLTDDRNPSLPARERSRSLLELFHAAFRRYTRYFDPDTLEPCSLSRILDHLALQKEQLRENFGSKMTFGMSPWKWKLMDRYLLASMTRLQQTRSLKKARKWIHEDPESRVFVWGRKPDNPLPEATGLVRVEDGFLRSAGLGAAFHMPLSLVFDQTGIYYDSTAPSDLETLLQNHDFSPDEIREAEELIELILSKALTKYNLEDPSESSAEWPGDRGDAVRILVPGQVEGDASIQWGSPKWQTNLDLLREVRRRNPDAVIAYKPHPDVVKNLRPGRPLSREIEDLCDRVVTDLDIVPWLESCDELHTLTSLSGFEALLRNKRVVCYGAPFYAGWGLTEDLVTNSRRSRTRTLEELVAAALIRYPRYLNPATGEFTTALNAAQLIANRGAPVFSRPWYLRLIASGKTLLRRR